MIKNIRVRFAPSPTGLMHLGNIRVAVMNYLFAKQKRGTLVLRIEDTDASRNVDEAMTGIIEDLDWLGIKFREGPGKRVGSEIGSFGPYCQSARTCLYQEKLEELWKIGRVYRCFCSQKTLAETREQQLAAGRPPRYDKTCLDFSQDKIDRKLNAGLSYIWRFKVNEHQLLDIDEMARGKVTFDMKNFSDFAITRQDGSFTFTFANFVDDWLMKISHVIRGEDHLTNTAMQSALYDALAVKPPTFWHLSMICNEKGEKLSKRDFGFSLQDLQREGFLPAAVCNYLAILGGSFEQEIMSLEELSNSFNFDKVHSGGGIKYDVEKLKWINHKWIERLSNKELLRLLKPFIKEAFPDYDFLGYVQLSTLISIVRPELKTLAYFAEISKFFFIKPDFDKDEIIKEIGGETFDVIAQIIDNTKFDCSGEELVKDLKIQAKQRDIKLKDLFVSIRCLLTGEFHGIGIKELFEVLGDKEVQSRLKRAVL
jgi:nondiscriminating glutamyl-tRNA synthetase